METVFDYNPTPEEIEENGFLDDFSLSMRHGIEFADPLTPDAYRAAINTQAAAFDLYLLFNGRGDQLKAAPYVSLVPEKVAVYRRGFDYQQVKLRS